MDEDKMRNEIWKACMSVIAHEEYDLRMQTCSIGCKDATVIVITCVQRERAGGI